MALDAAVFLMLLLSGVCSSWSLRQYEFVQVSLYYTEAQQYCRQNHRDLASVSNSEDVAELLRVTSGASGWGFWIGLMKSFSSEWRWSLGDPAFYARGESLYRNWAANQTNGNQDCAYMTQDGLWRIDACTTQRPFICYNDTSKGFIPVMQTVSWRSAQIFCRANHADLSSVRNPCESQQLQQVMNSSGATSAWIGLFRDPWGWSDHSPSSFRNWALGEPNQPHENATVMVISGQRRGQWEDWPYESQFPFVCYEDQLILIRQNLSWAEAMRHCRQHHVDLVTVRSAQEEWRVKRVARKASTPAVWMGLHHYCSKNVWLWLCDETVCYQNWAPGAGAGPRPEDCGRDWRVGAMQTAGDQRWISLPPSHTLNFICSTNAV